MAENNQIPSFKAAGQQFLESQGTSDTQDMQQQDKNVSDTQIKQNAQEVLGKDAQSFQQYQESDSTQFMDNKLQEFKKTYKIQNDTDEVPYDDSKIMDILQKKYEQKSPKDNIMQEKNTEIQDGLDIVDSIMRDSTKQLKQKAIKSDKIAPTAYTPFEIAGKAVDKGKQMLARMNVINNNLNKKVSIGKDGVSTASKYTRKGLKAFNNIMGGKFLEKTLGNSDDNYVSSIGRNTVDAFWPVAKTLKKSVDSKNIKYDTIKNTALKFKNELKGAKDNIMKEIKISPDDFKKTDAGNRLDDMVNDLVSVAYKKNIKKEVSKETLEQYDNNIAKYIADADQSFEKQFVDVWESIEKIWKELLEEGNINGKNLWDALDKRGKAVRNSKQWDLGNWTPQKGAKDAISIMKNKLYQKGQEQSIQWQTADQYMKQILDEKGFSNMRGSNVFKQINNSIQWLHEIGLQSNKNFAKSLKWGSGIKNKILNTLDAFTFVRVNELFGSKSPSVLQSNEKKLPKMFDQFVKNESHIKDYFNVADQQINRFKKQGKNLWEKLLQKGGDSYDTIKHNTKELLEKWAKKTKGIWDVGVNLVKQWTENISKKWVKEAFEQSLKKGGKIAKEWVEKIVKQWPDVITSGLKKWLSGIDLWLAGELAMYAPGETGEVGEDVRDIYRAIPLIGQIDTAMDRVVNDVSFKVDGKNISFPTRTHLPFSTEKDNIKQAQFDKLKKYKGDISEKNYNKIYKEIKDGNLLWEPTESWWESLAKPAKVNRLKFKRRNAKNDKERRKYTSQINKLEKEVTETF